MSINWKCAKKPHEVENWFVFMKLLSSSEASVRSFDTLDIRSLETLVGYLHPHTFTSQNQQECFWKKLRFGFFFRSRNINLIHTLWLHLSDKTFSL